MHTSVSSWLWFRWFESTLTAGCSSRGKTALVTLDILDGLCSQSGSQNYMHGPFSVASRCVSIVVY